MDIGAVLIALGMGFLQLIVGLVLAMVSIYMGLSLFGKFTKGIEEEEELKKGNAAVGILLAAIILAIATVVQSGVAGMTGGMLGTGGWQAVVGGFVQVVFGLIFAVVAIYLALSIWDKITKNIDETEELKKGNVAIGIVMAGVLLAVAFVINASVGGMAIAVTQALVNI